jgi:hypothetical protein
MGYSDLDLKALETGRRESAEGAAFAVIIAT